MTTNAAALKTGREYLAAADVSTKQYTFFKRGSGKTAVPAGAGEAAIGVLYHPAAAADRAITVLTGDRVSVYAGTGGLAVGDEVASDANGKGVAAVSTNVVLGICTIAAAADGEAQVELLGEAQYTKA